MAVGPAAAITEPLQAAILISAKYLVAGLAGPEGQRGAAKTAFKIHPVFLRLTKNHTIPLVINTKQG